MGTLEQTDHVSVENSGKSKRTFRGLLVDKRFQLKYTLIVVFIAIVISAVLGILLFDRVTENTGLVLDHLKALNATPEWLEHSEKALTSRDGEVMIYLIAALVVLVLAITVLGIYVSNKVAGPVYVMSRYLRDIASGSLRDVRALRSGDELLDFYDTFQKMLTALQDREKQDIATLETSMRTLRDQMERLAGAGELPERALEELNRVVDALGAMKKKKQEALG
jgi:methyl-accepting chemotaxis protein